MPTSSPETAPEKKSSPEDKKRKTLPKDFDELVASGDVNAIKAVFDRCRLEAYSGQAKETALANPDMPDDAIRWLVSKGADINAQDIYGATPLHKACSRWDGKIELLVKLGADIEARNNSGETPLHRAACSFIPPAVEQLIVLGANASARNNRDETPLEEALAQCQNSHIARMADVADILLRAGVQITSASRESVRRIGETFEFYRQDFANDHLAETEDALARLGAMFDVAPAPKREIHNGSTPIIVTARTWQKQHAELWNSLVPGQGSAGTVQGEAIRITGKIAYEVLDNGGINWDDDFRKMLAALLRFLHTGTPLSQAELDEAAQLIGQLDGGFGEKEPDRLCELAVRWVLANPNPIPLAEAPYRR